MISRSALASERFLHFSACTLCTNQNAPARKMKTATMPQSSALMRKVRNFWSSRYTRILAVSIASVSSAWRDRRRLGLLARDGGVTFFDGAESIGVVQIESRILHLCAEARLV